MATYLDQDSYDKFKGTLDLGNLVDDLHAQLNSISPPVPADQADRQSASDAGAVLPSAAPAGSPAAVPDAETPPPPVSAPASSAAPLAPLDPVTASLSPPPAAPESPTAPVTAPLVAPDPHAMLDKNGVVAYVHQRAAELGLDPAAVLAVAAQEGLNTAPGSRWTLPGEGNISFGPPSWYGNGAGSAIIQEHGPNAAAWSWTPPGIDYWLGQVAQVAKGLSGNQAISAIVHGFERPREDLAAGEISKAQSQYGTFQKPGGEITTAQGAAPVADNSGGKASSPLDSVVNGFHQQIDAAASAAGQAKDQVGTSLQDLADSFHQKLNDALSTGTTSKPGPPIQGDYTSLLPGGTQNPVEAAGQAAEQVNQNGPIAATGAAVKGIGQMGLLAKAEDPTVTNDQLAQQAIMALSAGSSGQGTTGADVFTRAIDQLKTYPAETAKPIMEFAAKAEAQGAPKSQIGATVQRWMEENPLPPPSSAPQLEPEIAASLKPGSGPLAPAAAPQPSTDALQGLIDLAKSKGLQTSDLETQLHAGQPAAEAPSNVAAAGPSTLPRTAPAPAPVTGPSAPPPAQYDPETGLWRISAVNDTAAAQRLATDTKAGLDKTPVSPDTTQPWSKVFADEGTMPSAASTPGAEIPPPALPAKAGITPETVQAAHERIDTIAGAGSDKAEAAHQQLDQMLQSGAAPDEIARFFSGLTGRGVTVPSVIRTVRTGSMAGGITTEGKVALGPAIQVAMRAPVGAIHALLTGHPSDIPAGLQGGLAGLAEGAADALQTMRYGINYRSALTGGAQGGYGFTPGLDVLGKNVAQRAAGTAAIGLVRTHGAISDMTSGMGRGAALATGSTPEQAAEVGQQWALRSGNYGTIGKAVSDAVEGIKQKNPALDVAGQILVPFFRVGYNVYTQGVEHSPVGLLGTAVDVARSKLPAAAGPALRGPYAAGAQNAAVTPAGQRLTRNMFGVGLAALGLAQATAGNVTGENPQQGAPKWSVRTPAGWVPLRTLGPLGEPLAQSAALYEAARDGRGDVAKIAEQTALSYKDHAVDETWLSGFGNIIGAITARGGQGASELGYQARNVAQSFVPQFTLGRQAAGAVGVTKQAPVPAGRSTRQAPAPARPSVPRRP